MYKYIKQIRTVAITATLLLCVAFCKAQTKNYKDNTVCTDSTMYKGKKNHGKFHCVSNMVVREYSNGKKDTISWMSSSRIFISDEYNQYQNLTDRGKYIVDSLKEDGVPMFQQDYLTYEQIYMKQGEKTYISWVINGEDISIYYYSVWKNSKGSGYRLLKDVVVK